MYQLSEASEIQYEEYVDNLQLFINSVYCLVVGWYGCISSLECLLYKYVDLLL